MGHMITTEGGQADQSKVEAILNMPTPTDVQFLPNLASDLQPIRELTRKNVDWNWSGECEEAFIKVKKITEGPLLIYFNPDKELVLQVDSSKDGLVAALLQDGKPIEYASRALTSAEKNWAQIEKETLAVVFGQNTLISTSMVERLLLRMITSHLPPSSISPSAKLLIDCKD